MAPNGALLQFKDKAYRPPCKAPPALVIMFPCCKMIFFWGGGTVGKLEGKAGRMVEPNNRPHLHSEGAHKNGNRKLVIDKGYTFIFRLNRTW